MTYDERLEKQLDWRENKVYRSVGSLLLSFFLSLSLYVCVCACARVARSLSEVTSRDVEGN